VLASACLCAALCLQHGAVDAGVELAPKLAGPSHGKPAAEARGRVRMSPSHDSLKAKAESEDKQSRRVRMQANKDYDAAHELMRKTGVLAHRMTRLSKGEGALRSLIEEVRAASTEACALCR
jgi:hypothetical protein